MSWPVPNKPGGFCGHEAPSLFTYLFECYPGISCVLVYLGLTDMNEPV